MVKKKERPSVNENTKLVLQRQKERDEERKRAAAQTPNRTGSDRDED